MCRTLSKFLKQALRKCKTARFAGCFVLALTFCLASASKAPAGELENRLLDVVEKGNAGAVDALLSRGADVNARDKEGSTPLHQAAYLGNHEIVKILIEKGANVNAKNRIQRTPLHEVASSTRLEGVSLPAGTLQRIAMLLIQKGADVNAGDAAEWTPLHCALFQGQSAIAKLLIESGANVNARENVNQWTPLHHAVSAGGRLEIVKLLVEKGADVNARNNNHQITPLHKAASRGWTEAAVFLIAKGADVTARNKNQWTPLDEAVHYGHAEVAKLLAFEQGMAAVRKQEWTAAARCFEQAYKLSNASELPVLLFNLGLAESKIQGRELRAMAWFQFYLHRSPSATNTGAVRGELAKLKGRVEATLDHIAGTMKNLAEQFPNDEQRRRACGYLALTQARAGHLREARETSYSGNCVNTMKPDVLNSVLHQIAESQSRAGDLEGAFQTLRELKRRTDRYQALERIVLEQSWIGEFEGAKSAVQRALREGMLASSDSAYMWEAIATAELLSGREESAVASAEKALAAYNPSASSVFGGDLRKTVLIHLVAGDRQGAEKVALRLKTRNQADYREMLSLDEDRAFDELRRKAVNFSPYSETFENRWRILGERLYHKEIFTDIRGAIAALADRESPDKILEGLSEISETVYYMMKEVARLGS